MLWPPRFKKLLNFWKITQNNSETIARTEFITEWGFCLPAYTQNLQERCELFIIKPMFFFWKRYSFLTSKHKNTFSRESCLPSLLLIKQNLHYLWYAVTNLSLKLSQFQSGAWNTLAGVSCFRWYITGLRLKLKYISSCYFPLLLGFLYPLALEAEVLGNCSDWCCLTMLRKTSRDRGYASVEKASDLIFSKS